MSTDNHVVFSGLNRFSYVLLIRCFKRTCKQYRLDIYFIFIHKLKCKFIMLTGQHLCRSHQCSLMIVCRVHNETKEGHNGLTATHISLQHTIHTDT